MLLACMGKEHSWVSDELGNELLREAPDRIQLPRSRKPEQQLLYARILVRGDTFADGRGTANQRSIAEEGSHPLRHFRLGLLIRILYDTVRP